MISLEYQEKGPRTLQMNIAQSSMTRRRYFSSVLMFMIKYSGIHCVNILFILIEGRADWRWNFLVVRVTFCPWEHSMGFCSSMYCNLGYILLSSAYHFNILLYKVPVAVTTFIHRKPLCLFVSLTWCPHIPTSRSWAAGILISGSKY